MKQTGSEELDRVFQTILDTYHVIWVVDLENDKCRCLKSTDEYEEKMYAESTDYSYVFRRCVERNVDERFQKLRLLVGSISNLQQKLRNQDTISCDYLTKDGEGRRSVFKRYEMKDGVPVKAIYFSVSIDEDRRKRLAARVDAMEEYQFLSGMCNNLENSLAKTRHASEVKSRFLSNVSHDLKTPLNAIMGFAEIAGRRCDDPGQVKECVDIILDQGDNMLLSINNMLDVAEAEGGISILDNTSFTMKQLVDKIREFATQKAQVSGIHFELETEGNMEDYLYADERHLLQILQQLLANAFTYNTSGGEVKLTVSCLGEAATGSYSYEFRVSDTGIGIAAEDIDHIFEPFYRVHMAGKFGPNGLGLGLMLVKSIVNRMNGVISVDSEQGAGSCFTIQLNLAKDTLRGEFTGQELSDFVGRRVLIVEDDELSGEIAAELLREMRASTELARDGACAVSMVTQKGPGYYDLILMDIRMPVMDGHMAARKIRELPWADSKTLPIIGMSADAFDDEQNESFGNSMNAHVGKPIDMEEVLRVYRSCI